MKNCLNCNASLSADDKFCSRCGQKAVDRLRFKTLLGELAQLFFAWDSKLFTTLKLLLFKPGQVAKEYIGGKRVSLVAPFRMYLFASIVFFLVLSQISSNIHAEINDVPAEEDLFYLAIGDDTLAMHSDTLLLMIQNDRLEELPIVQTQDEGWPKIMTQQIIKVGVQNGGFLTFFQKNISFMFFLFIPVFGFVLQIFNRRKKFDYMEHLVYGLYFHSTLFVILLVAVPLSYFLSTFIPILLALLFMLFYLVRGVKGFYEYRWVSAITRSVLIIGLYVFLFLIFAGSTLLLTIWNY